MIDNHCIKCGRPLRDGKCAYGCDNFGNYKRFNNNQRKAREKRKVKTISLLEKKCYYCGSIEKLELDILPDGRRVYFCPWHFQRNYYSLVSKRYPEEAKKPHFIKALANLVSKRKEERRGAGEM